MLNWNAHQESTSSSSPFTTYTNQPSQPSAVLPFDNAHSRLQGSEEEEQEVEGFIVEDKPIIQQSLTAPTLPSRQITAFHPGLIPYGNPTLDISNFPNLLVPGAPPLQNLPSYTDIPNRNAYIISQGLATISVQPSSVLTTPIELSSIASSSTTGVAPVRESRFQQLLRQKQANEALALQNRLASAPQQNTWNTGVAEHLDAAKLSVLEAVASMSSRKASESRDDAGSDRNSGDRNPPESPTLGDDRQRSASSVHMAPPPVNSSPRLHSSPTQSSSAQVATNTAYRPQSQQSAYFQRLMATKLAGMPAGSQDAEYGVEGDGLPVPYYNGNNGDGADQRSASAGATTPTFPTTSFAAAQSQYEGNGAVAEVKAIESSPVHPSSSEPRLPSAYPPYYNTQSSPSTAVEAKQSPHPGYAAWPTPPNTAGVAASPSGAKPAGYQDWNQPWDGRAQQPPYPPYPYPYGAHGVKPEYGHPAPHHYAGVPAYGYPGAPPAGYGYTDRPLGYDGHHPYGGYPHYPVDASSHAHGVPGGHAGHGEGSANGGGSASGSGGGPGRTGLPNGDTPKKAVLACHFCRMRKLKCDGEKDSCANCTRRGLACTYDLVVRRRGPGKKKKGQDADKVGDVSGTTGSEADPSSSRRSKDGSAPSSAAKRSYDEQMTGSLGNGVPAGYPSYPPQNGYAGYYQPPQSSSTQGGGFNMDHGAYDPGQYMHQNPAEGERFDNDKPFLPPVNLGHSRTESRDRQNSGTGYGVGDDGPASKRLRKDDGA